MNEAELPHYAMLAGYKGQSSHVKQYVDLFVWMSDAGELDEDVKVVAERLRELQHSQEPILLETYLIESNSWHLRSTDPVRIRNIKMAGEALEVELQWYEEAAKTLYAG